MLTVICSSRLGTHTLPQVLSSYECLEPPRGGWKLVVVNDCRSARTSAILKSYASRLPLEIVRESTGPASAAFNAALRSVVGDLVVFTDASSIPAPNWLWNLRETADRVPGFAVFAGSILPCWDSAPEHGAVGWDEQGMVCALAEPRLDAGPIAPDFVWAPNVAIRAELLASDSQLAAGDSPASEAAGVANTEALIDRICSAGCRTWYVPGAVVRHSLSDLRPQGTWLMRTALRRGRAVATLELEQRARRMRGILRPFWAATRLLCKRQLGFWKARLSGDLQAALRARWRRDLALGKLLECRRYWLLGRVG